MSDLIKDMLGLVEQYKNDEISEAGLELCFRALVVHVKWEALPTPDKIEAWAQEISSAPLNAVVRDVKWAAAHDMAEWFKEYLIKEKT